MRFIVETNNTRDVSALLAAEGQAATELVSHGVFLDVWHKADASGAIVLAQADSEDSLRESISVMPTVQSGATEVSITALADTP